LKNTPDLMLGTAQRLTRQVREVRKRGRGGSLDKSFPAQPV
jgi:hypothetical protein